MGEARKLLSVHSGSVNLEDGIDVIEQLTGGLRIVVMIGDGRSGKSFLANKIIGEEVFVHAPTPEAVTAGIDLYSKPLADGHLLIWDCEGGNNALARTHQMVNVLGMVAASKIIWVVAGMASDAAFETLERNFASRELAMQGESLEDQEFLFLVNKNDLHYESHHFEAMLQERKGNAISALYPQNQRQFLSLGFQGAPGFEKELGAVLETVRSTKSRTFAGLPMSGPQLGRLLRMVYKDFDIYGQVQMPEMARVVIYDNFLLPMIKEQTEQFSKALPSDREQYVEDSEIYDTRLQRLDAFTQRTKHIRTNYGDFSAEAKRDLSKELNKIWEFFALRNDELGEMFVKSWQETQAPVNHTKEKEVFDFLGRRQIRYIDVHDIQTRIAQMRANGRIEYGEWATVSQEERNERNQPRRRTSVYADFIEWKPTGTLGKMWRCMERFCSGGGIRCANCNDVVDSDDDIVVPPRSIHDAAYQGDVERMRDYIINGHDLNEASEMTLMTPLHHAARKGHLEIAQMLLERRDVNVNARDNWSGTPLHAASSEGHLDIVRLLLATVGISVRPLNHFEKTPCDLAIKYNREEIVQLLRAAESADNARHDGRRSQNMVRWE